MCDCKRHCKRPSPLGCTPAKGLFLSAHFSFDFQQNAQ